MTTRRDFLKHSALGAAGLTIGGLGFSTESFANIMGANEKIRVGIVGFSDRSEEFKEKVIRESMEFEQQMPFPPVPGAMEFIHLLKSKDVKVGLVTSSDDAKLKRAFRLLKLDNLFDTVVSADRITKGKPDPMCYLLAASDLHVSPSDSLVFEDSFAGIQAGTNAGMRVIGLSTTNSEESLKDKVYQVIPDFQNITFEEYKQW